MTLKVFLVGCGEHALEKIVPSLASISHVQVTGLCDPSHEALEKAGRWFPSAKKIMKSPLSEEDISDYDAIVVAGPPQLHHHVAKVALISQIPVFVEKPPAVLTSEMEELANLAVQNNVTTCVGHNLRHSLAAVHFQNSVLAPGFGRPVAMEMRYLASKPRGKRWGLDSSLRSFLLSHANHAIDLMIYQMGEIREVVAARGWPDIDGGIAISVQFIFKSGAVGNLLATSYAPHFTVSASAISDTGSVVCMNNLNEVQVQGKHENGKRWSTSWQPRTLETGYNFAGYKTELERFFIAIENKDPDQVHPSFSDCVEIYKAIDAIESSIAGSNHRPK